MLFILFIAVIASAAALCRVYYYYKNRKEIDEVRNCSILLKLIEAAKTNVSVCMPINSAMEGRLLNVLKKANVKIRIIIGSNGYTESVDFLLKELIKAGAEIKCREEPYTMQHKFFLIDDKMLIAFNWGNDSSCDNWNVYITNKLHLVDRVKREFHQMWSAAIAMEESYLPTSRILPIITITEATP